jgi:hypothetical protein
MSMPPRKNTKMIADRHATGDQMMKVETASELTAIVRFIKIAAYLKDHGVLSGFIFPDE